MKSSAIVPGMRGGQFLAEFRGRTPAERDQLVSALKDQVTVVEGPWITNILITFNTEHKPFDDVRVRRALSLAIDRWGGGQSLGKVTLIKGVGGVFRPGAPWALPNADLEKLSGFWRDANKSREEAKRLLKEAGVTKLKVKLLNRTVAQPFTPAGIYAIDQWRRIGVETEHVQVETKLWYDGMGNGNFDAAVQNISDFADDPNAQFNTLLSKHASSIAYSRHTDTKIDEMYALQSRTIDPVERLRIVHELERYTLDAGLQRAAALVPAHRRQPSPGQGLGAAALALRWPDPGRCLAGQVGIPNGGRRQEPAARSPLRPSTDRLGSQDVSQITAARCVRAGHCHCPGIRRRAEEGWHPEFCRRRRAPDARLPRGNHLRVRSSRASPLLDAAEMAGRRRHPENRRRSRHGMGGVEGRPRLHLQASPERQVP